MIAKKRNMIRRKGQKDTESELDDDIARHCLVLSLAIPSQPEYGPACKFSVFTQKVIGMDGSFLHIAVVLG